jgi:hypothetical protein
MATVLSLFRDSFPGKFWQFLYRSSLSPHFSSFALGERSAPQFPHDKKCFAACFTERRPRNLLSFDSRR